MHILCRPTGVVDGRRKKRKVSQLLPTGIEGEERFEEI